MALISVGAGVASILSETMQIIRVSISRASLGKVCVSKCFLCNHMVVVIRKSLLGNFLVFAQGIMGEVSIILFQVLGPSLQE